MRFEAPEGYPVAMGNEEETGLQFRIEGYSQPCEIDEMPGDYTRRFYQGDLHEDDWNLGNFTRLRNGFRIYPGGSEGCAGIGDSNPERATPECLTPEETVAYIEVGAERLFDMVEGVMREVADLPKEQQREKIKEARVQRRVIDAYGNTKGCHDNFSIGHMSEDQRRDLETGVTLHTLTRSFITGAGYIDEDVGFSFGQKMNSVTAMSGTGYGSQLFALKDGGRLEVRCSDPNISQWSTWMRLGSSALLVAMMSTPLAGEIKQLAEESLDFTERTLSRIAAEYNIYGNKRSTNAVDVQEQLATMALDRLQLYTDLPTEYFRLANEWLAFAEDYRKVLTTESPLETLSDRSDWARKLLGIQEGITADREDGKKRDIRDIDSQMKDMLYDNVQFTLRDDGTVCRRYGWGYRDRAMDKFHVAKPKDIVAAKVKTPDSRARLRHAVVQAARAANIFVQGVGWEEVTMSHTKDSQIVGIALPLAPDAMKLEPAALTVLVKMISMRQSDFDLTEEGVAQTLRERA